jgi:hypothetical protein
MRIKRGGLVEFLTLFVLGAVLTFVVYLVVVLVCWPG